jgi:hypothetical protein
MPRRTCGTTSPGRTALGWAAFFACCWPAELAKADGPDSATVPVRVDERVELLSVVFRLLEAHEYSMTPGTVPYAKEVDAHFGPFKDHEAVRLARELRGERGIGYDAVASFAVHLRGAPRMEPKIPFDDKASDLESRWSPESATRFLAALQRFADDTKAFEFFDKHRDLYAKSAERLAREIAKRPYRAWLDKFFAAKPGAKFCAIVGMLNGGSNYGQKLAYPDGSEEILPIIGAEKFDASGLPVFGGDDAGLVAHEFCHAYCNPLVDRFADKLLPSAERIFQRRAALLKEQAYGSARTMLYESLVRACTHRFLSAHGTPEQAAAELREEVRRGFFWTPELSALLLEYEGSRQKYATLADFMPRVIDFFEKLAGSLDERLARLPRITKLVPANGAAEVSPEVTEIRVEFDRPMDPAGVGLFGGQGGLFGKKGDPAFKGRFSPDGKTFIQPVKVEPGKTYRFSVNSVWQDGFKSADGLPLDPVRVTFTTAKAAGDSGDHAK